jgi:hypothetical protein
MRADLVRDYGAPASVWNAVTVNGESGAMDVSLYWFNKTSTRMPESIWFSFKPTVRANYRWLMTKLEEPVSPYDVVVNGSFHLHAIDSVRFVSSSASAVTANGGVGDVGSLLQMTPIDSPLLAFGAVSALATPLSPPDFSQGASFNLVNNVWGTNYVMWYPFESADVNAVYRFRINLQ